MDEPCSALDPTSTRRDRGDDRRAAGDITIVIVTHNMQQAQRVCRQVRVLPRGRRASPAASSRPGPPSKMFSDPDDQRTLDYVRGRFG